MKELETALNTMTDETYSFHANTEKNDFTNWVQDVIKDEKLAQVPAKSAQPSPGG